MQEYNKRINKKIRSGNLVFSYVQMSSTLGFSFLSYTHYFSFYVVLDPDDHDENIGKFANAACRELNETNNCYVCLTCSFAVLYYGIISVFYRSKIQNGEY